MAGLKATSRVRISSLAIATYNRAAVTALEKTTENLLTEVVQSQVFPFQSGTLQNKQTSAYLDESHKGKTYIVSATPYARRLYFHPEYNFSTASNPNAKGRWFEDWLEGGAKSGEVRQMFIKFYRREAGL